MAYLTNFSLILHYEIELRNLLEYSKILQKVWEGRKNIPF
jgi:hypothetical protein